MNFANETEFNANWTLGFDREGREILVVAVKGTFLIAPDGDVVQAAEQVPLVKADEFTGEPGLSAPLLETDFSHYKPHCDVLLNGSAYAPNGRPTDRVTVGFRVGSLNKSFEVVGLRHWYSGTFAPKFTEPQPFLVQSISYDVAYGGTDVHPDNPTDVRTYLANPVGRGYYPLAKNIDGKPLPATEEIGRSATDANGSYRPMSFGPIGRNWPSRTTHTGTYDKDWLDNRAPFWPDDFDYQYFQAAPEDQQMAYPEGGEEVALLNLTPDGVNRFRLPKVALPVLLIPRDGDDRWGQTAIDTLVLEPDRHRFMLTWRTVFPLRKDLFEISDIIIGREPRHRRAELRSDKPFYAGLDELAKARRGERQ